MAKGTCLHSVHKSSYATVIPRYNICVLVQLFLLLLRLTSTFLPKSSVWFTWYFPSVLHSHNNPVRQLRLRENDCPKVTCTFHSWLGIWAQVSPFLMNTLVLYHRKAVTWKFTFLPLITSNKSSIIKVKESADDMIVRADLSQGVFLLCELARTTEIIAGGFTEEADLYDGGICISQHICRRISRPPFQKPGKPGRSLHDCWSFLMGVYWSIRI